MPGFDGQFNARLQRLERMSGQGSGGSGGDGLPSYDNEDIGKVLTVVSQSETGAEAIPAQTVTIAQGTATVQNANVSQWTEGQSLQVIYRGTMYTGKITDAEGSLVFATDDFTLRYDSSTGVLTVEDVEHSGDNTISARYVTEHANVDWSPVSGGSLPPFTDSDVGKVLKIVTSVETVIVVPSQTVTTNAEGNAELSEVDFSKLTDGDTVIVELGDMSFNTIYHSTPDEGLYYQNYLVITPTALLGGMPNDEIDVTSYAKLPSGSTAEWVNSTEAFIVRVIGGNTDKTYSEIESALRSGRPCTLLIYDEGVVIETGIMFNPKYVPELEGEKKYIVNFLVGTEVETMDSSTPNGYLAIE